jgi:hypothetical protein
MLNPTEILYLVICSCVDMTPSYQFDMCTTYPSWIEYPTSMTMAIERDQNLLVTLINPGRVVLITTRLHALGPQTGHMLVARPYAWSLSGLANAIRRFHMPLLYKHAMQNVSRP